ncbi:unnamed protein product [Phytophthora fragariaefolia]|uniref:Unnamed protein product n=1 Tax=Phytophthora fragariaefolia TaxID=1490495 RepID=A0A9W6YPR9_9STRA|nr:unnamed protein product [Phytophthora fragariaefolia]
MRKRLSLAAEVLGDPVIFFVDEPTSGLDSFMAESVVMQLQRIARQGETVLATTHQPSSELFARFDRLYLMADGAVAYDGLAKGAVAYFNSHGYSCSAFSTPADYFMGQLTVVDEAGAERVRELIQVWKAHQDTTSTEPGRAGYYETSFFVGENLERLDRFSQVIFLSQRNLDLGQTGVQNFVEVFLFMVISQTPTDTSARAYPYVNTKVDCIV